jgi:hypothetical protein
MSGGDLVARWTRYLNAFMAEWAVPEDLIYALGEPGQEPIPVLNPTDARFYASWLRLHGYITTTEWRCSGWLSRTTMPGAATRYNARNAAPPGGKAARWQTTTANAFGSMTTG